MARRYGRALCSRWHDSGWTALPVAQQWMYETLTSQGDISWCGVMPYVPQRLASLAPDMTPRRAVAALDALAAGRFVIIDANTAEVLVRSFIRHEEPLAQPNLARAVARAYDKVHSETLREAIREELRRLLGQHPELAGWSVLRRDNPGILEPFAEPLANPSPNGHPKGSEDPSQQASTYKLQPSTGPEMETSHHVVTHVTRDPSDGMMR